MSEEIKDGWAKKPKYWESSDNLFLIPELIIQDNIKKDSKKVDGIFVLAGGIEPSGNCHPWIKDRLYLAYQYYKHNPVSIFILGGGSYHMKPIVNKNGYIVHESTSCSEYLIGLGVNPSHIYKEWSSYDTIANGFFGFSHFVLPLKLSSIILITSEFHMPRSKEIFDWMKKCFQNDIEINYISSSDHQIDKEVLECRAQREKQSLENLKTKVIDYCDTIEKFHKWFYTEHKAYCSNSEIIRTCEVNEDERKSY